MKKLLLISALIIAMPLSMLAQDDDLYFVPKKQKKTERAADDTYGMPRKTYYAGSTRSVDEYNRRYNGKSTVEVINGDSTLTDVIDFSAEVGVYPDSIEGDDYQLTREMTRFDDYVVADNAAFWAGYEAGRNTWGWYSPWYYSRYGWYGGYYDPWYYGSWSWRYGFYDPWYYGSWGWHYGYYDPWYYGSWGYYPHYYPHYSMNWIGGSAGHRHSTIGAGTIRRDGATRIGYRSGRSLSNSRVNEIRSNQLRNQQRSSTNRSASNRTYDRDRTVNRSYDTSRSSYSNSSFGSSRSSSSSGGSFSSGGSRGGGGGGGARMGGRR